MDAAASAFVAAHADAEALESGKIRCTVTGHEMRPILSELEAHWASKTYLKKKERAEYDFDQHAPWLVPHKSDAGLMWCRLTRQAVSRQAQAVEAHVSGQRFKRLLTAAQPRAKPEPEDLRNKLSRHKEARAEEGNGANAAEGGDAAASGATPHWKRMLLERKSARVEVVPGQ